MKNAMSISDEHVDAISDEFCFDQAKHLHPKYFNFDPDSSFFKGNNLCANLGPNRERFCQGDSGGPIFRENPKDEFRAYLLVNSYLF